MFPLRETKRKAACILRSRDHETEIYSGPGQITAHGRSSCLVQDQQPLLRQRFAIALEVAWQPLGMCGPTWPRLATYSRYQVDGANTNINLKILSVFAPQAVFGVGDRYNIVSEVKELPAIQATGRPTSSHLAVVVPSDSGGPKCVMTRLPWQSCDFRS